MIVNSDIENIPKRFDLTLLTNRLYKIKPYPIKNPTDADTKSKLKPNVHILIVSQNI